MKFERFVDVTWADCDPAGIAFYGNFFRWFDAGTHALLAHIGFDVRTLNDRFDIMGPSLVAVNCNYRQPVSYGLTIRHKVSISAVGTKSFQVQHVFWNGDSLSAEGHETRVCIARQGDDRFAAIPLPEAFRSSLRGDRN